MAGELPVNQFFFDDVYQVAALLAGVDAVYFPVYVYAGYPGEVQARFRGGDDRGHGLSSDTMVLHPFPNWGKFLQHDLR